MQIVDKMASYRRSRTNGTSFQDIPKEDYVEAIKFARKLTRKKKLLTEKVQELAPIRTAYIKYLAANPHKDKKVRLEKEIAQLREELIKDIPNKWNT